MLLKTVTILNFCSWILILTFLACSARLDKVEVTGLQFEVLTFNSIPPVTTTTIPTGIK